MSNTPKNIKLLNLWLISCILLLLAMIFIGGVTRLTNSGLSIVEWRPITGTIPPLSDDSWNEEFAKYKNSPEYKQVNYGMTMSEFKKIYLIEYFHRLLGRVIGIVFFIPFIIFCVRKCFTANQIKLLSVVIMLGLLQGFIGWYMVSSGLVDRPSVSQYRLALHLLLAVILISLLFWILFSIWNNAQSKSSTLQFNIINIMLLIDIIWIFVQIVSGAFVAGLNAGLIYNTFPLMGDRFIPQEIWDLTPKYLNIFDNHAMVQLIHRLSAYAILGYNIILFGIIFIKKSDITRLFAIFMLVLLSQLILGVMTLIYQVPIHLASLHQVNAIIALGILIYIYNIRIFRIAYNRRENA